MNELFDETKAYCERCCHHFDPGKESRVTVREPKQFPRTLVICPKCMNEVRAVLYTPKEI